MTNSALLSSLHTQADTPTVEVERGWLGVGIGNLPKDAHQADQGVVVCRVQPASPAEQAGLQPGDVLHTLNGHGLTDATHLKDELEKLGAGTSIQLTLTRKGHSQSLELTLGKKP